MAAFIYPLWNASPVLRTALRVRTVRVMAIDSEQDAHTRHVGTAWRTQSDGDAGAVILNIISDMPSYGYRRVWGILRKQRRTEGQPPVNAKRLYRIMSEHNLLLLHHKPERPKREHKGKIAVAESDMRWCSDGFEFGCDNGEKLRVTFALDCCDREAIDWAASTGGYDSSTVQDVMLRSVEKRFGDRLPDTAVQWLTDNGSAYTAHETRRFAKVD